MANHRKCECGTCQRCNHRARMHAWYWRNRDKACEIARNTRLRNLEAIRESDRERGFRPRPAVKEAAYREVARAIRHGVLVREPCEVCGAEKTDAHHDDYSEPLEVRWLCRVHHGLEHRREVSG